MMTTKPELQTCAQDECGVWLDPVQLKVKTKQKRVRRPISKLLNPFAKGGGYSLAVALNFTQTKTEMPKTKQSSISTFFAPQRRILKKMSSTEASKSSSFHSTASTLTDTTHASSTKRGREMDYELSECDNSEEHQENDAGAVEWRDQDEDDSFEIIYGETEEQFEEIHVPQRKRRLADASSLPVASSSLPQAWSQDPLMACSQDCNTEFNVINQENTSVKNLNNSETTLLNTQSEEAFGFQMDVAGRTSTQKSFALCTPSQIDGEKENFCLSSISPSKHSPLCPLKAAKASPLKRVPEHLQKKADDTQDPIDSQIIWAKPRNSPLKKHAAQQRGREADEDSLAVLFTQDSQGFRVIAHRGRKLRSPLKDQSNTSTGTARGSGAYKYPNKEDEEDEFLFTQDSQGNMVIRH